MKQYIRRAVKYVIYFTLLALGVFALLNVTGYSTTTLPQLVQSSRGWSLWAVIGGFSLVYPLIGFARRRLSFNAGARIEDVERIMGMCGFKKISGDGDRMIFRARSWVKRLSMVFEDRLEITTDGRGASYISGHRGEVVRAAFRMGTYIA